MNGGWLIAVGAGCVPASIALAWAFWNSWAFCGAFTLGFVNGFLGI